MLALHPDSGALAWYFQMTPHDIFDWAGVNEGILVDETIDGKHRVCLLQANRNGFLYALDRKSGELIYAKPYTRTTWADIEEDGKPVLKPEIERETIRRVFPGRVGGHNWPPAAINPRTHMIYIPENERATTFIPRTTPFRLGGLYMGGAARDDGEGDGYLTAVDVRTGLVAWRHKFEGESNWAGALVTAGGLVFAGGPDGVLRAFNDETGEVLWRYQAADGICAPPISFMLGDAQVVGVSAGNAGMSGKASRASKFYLLELANR
jgi:alcohol dehydrogenase (cytochrome c)